MATIRLILHKSWKHRAGTYPLVFQIIHNRRKKLVYTNYKIEEANFNSKEQKVQPSIETKLSVKMIATINRVVKQQLKVLRAQIAEFEKSGIPFTVKDLGDKPLTTHCTQVLEYMDRQINLKLLGKHYGIAHAYKSTRLSFAHFLGIRDIDATQVTSQLIRRYEAFLCGRGVSENTVAYYMRNLKTIYSRIGEDGYKVNPDSPFRGIKTGVCKTIKRAISREELVKIAQLKFDSVTEKHIELARDMFLFSYYTCGMAFVDIAYLRKSDIEGGIITYCRRKSKQQIRLSVIEPLERMIDKYQSSSDYVMPILNADLPQVLYDQYKLALGRINKNLKVIGKYAGLSYRLTTYVARHSWATQVKMLGTSTSVISQGLGHTSEKTTRIYLQEFDSKVIDGVNRSVSMLE